MDINFKTILYILICFEIYSNFIKYTIVVTTSILINTTNKNYKNENIINTHTTQE